MRSVRFCRTLFVISPSICLVTDNSDPRSVIISVATAGDDIEDDDNADRSHDDDFYNSQMISHMSDDDNSNHGNYT